MFLLSTDFYHCLLNRRVWLAGACVRVSWLAELGHVVAWRRR